MFNLQGPRLDEEAFDISEIVSVWVLGCKEQN